MNEVRIITPTLCLGYGFSEEEFARALDQHRPHVIAVDAGSTDPGPYYLGSGKSFTNRLEVKAELRVLIDAARRLRIPLIVGSAPRSADNQDLAIRRVIFDKDPSKVNTVGGARAACAGTRLATDGMAASVWLPGCSSS